MQSSTHKRVVIRKHDKSAVKGYVNPNHYLAQASVEVLDLEAHVVSLPLEEVKGIYFVRDFDGNPDRDERKVFQSRPKLNGLWIRMTFKDEEVLDGLISDNLLAIEPHGYLVVPPDVYSNNLKIFIPRSALAKVEVLGVITNGRRRRLHKAEQAPRKDAFTTSQIGLFPPLDQSPATR